MKETNLIEALGWFIISGVIAGIGIILIQIIYLG